MAPKTKNTKQTETPVVEKTVTPVAPVQEAGAKKTPAKKAAPAKVVEKTAEVAAPKVEPVVAKKAAPVKKAAGKQVAKEVPAEEKKAVAPKKAAAPKKEKVVEKVVEADEEEEGDSKTRSFKVKLPGDEGFTGRFTGLTPYQAANKALSKHFRSLENNSEADVQVNFSIRESTRGSKRHEYNYKGSRIKLDQPITYTIKSDNGEARVITKQYKNQLIKVKKNAAKQENVTV
jgi:hypothetical protein